MHICCEFIENDQNGCRSYKKSDRGISWGKDLTGNGLSCKIFLNQKNRFLQEAASKVWITIDFKINGHKSRTLKLLVFKLLV
jgi:hypothetical protein